MTLPRGPLTNETPIDPGVMFRFYKKIKIADDGCVEWTGPLNRGGYGRFSAFNNHSLAHRWVWRIEGLRLIDGMVLDHLCKNRKCVRIDHLRQVTPAQNSMENSLSVSAVNSRKNACIRGHPFDAGNTQFTKRGHRRCAECHRAEMRAK